MATATYGIKIKVIPDTSGNNPPFATTALYRSTSAGGTYTLVASQRGTSPWSYVDALPLGSGTKYYKARTEFTLMTSSAYTAVHSAEPADLGVEGV